MGAILALSVQDLLLHLGNPCCPLCRHDVAWRRVVHLDSARSWSLLTAIALVSRVSANAHRRDVIDLLSIFMALVCGGSDRLASCCGGDLRLVRKACTPDVGVPVEIIYERFFPGATKTHTPLLYGSPSD